MRMAIAPMMQKTTITPGWCVAKLSARRFCSLWSVGSDSRLTSGMMAGIVADG